MKKFIFSLFCIFYIIIDCFGDTPRTEYSFKNQNALTVQVKKDLQTKCAALPELEKRGFDLSKLDDCNSLEDMFYYISGYFFREDNTPLDAHSFFSFYDEKTNNSRSIFGMNKYSTVRFSDKYGTKEVLLKQGYVENETMFYYPLYNGKWTEDGYRVGERIIGFEGGPVSVCLPFYEESENALYCYFSSFKKDALKENQVLFNKIQKSKKDYLIIDVSSNGGGLNIQQSLLLKNIKKMNPKKVLVIASGSSFSCGDVSVRTLKKEFNATIIGTPTSGSILYGNQEIFIYCINGSNICLTYGTFFDENDLEVVKGTEDGYGFNPDIYAFQRYETVEVVEHIINEKIIFNNKRFDPYSYDNLQKIVIDSIMYE